MPLNVAIGIGVGVVLSIVGLAFLLLALFFGATPDLFF